MGRTRSNKLFGNTDPPPKLEFEKRRSCRGSNPTCTHFGVANKRRFIYPSGFFCCNCEWYESQITSGAGNRIKRDSQKYACQAYHYDWVYPREKWTVSGNKFMSVEDIQYEEERCRLEEAAEKRACRKRKYDQSPIIDESLISTAGNDDNNNSHSVMSIQAPRMQESVVDEDAKISDGDDSDGDTCCNTSSDEDVLLGHKVTLTNDAQDVMAKPGTLSTNHTEETVVYLKKRIAALKKKLEQTQQNMHRWKRKCLESIAVSSGVVAGEGVHVVQCASTAIEQLMHSEEQYMYSSGRHSVKARKEYRNAVALSIWTNGSTFYENLRHLIIAHVKCHLRETVFHPAKILMQMDLAGGTLSMEGLEVLRMCETDGKRYVRNTIICSSADIKRCCAKVDKLAKMVVPYERGHLDEANGGGEFIQWEPCRMMAAMINAYQLTNVAKDRPIEVHIAIDGAMISKNWNHLTAGMKQGDNAAVCPRRKHLIYGNVDETTIQSRDHCFPYIMAMCRETKKSIEWMRPRLEQLEALGKEGANWWEDYKPLQVVHNSDLSLMWKYRERGGAAKVKKYCCHCCTLKSDDIVTPNDKNVSNGVILNLIYRVITRLLLTTQIWKSTDAYMSSWVIYLLKGCSHLLTFVSAHV